MCLVSPLVGRQAVVTRGGYANRKGSVELCEQAVSGLQHLDHRRDEAVDF